MTGRDRVYGNRRLDITRRGRRTAEPDLYEALLRTLGRGRKAAITQKDLIDILNVEGREIRAAVQLYHETDGGSDVICSGDAGYWLADCLEDVEGATRRYRAQAHSLLRKAENIWERGKTLPRRQGRFDL